MMALLQEALGRFRRFLVPGLLILLLLVTFLVYRPGLIGNFIFDDYPNIVSNYPMQITDLSWTSLRQAWSSGIATNLSRPLSMITFAVNHRFTGLDPYAFKLTNVFIHLAVSTALFFLARKLLFIGLKPQPDERGRLQYIALVIAAFWALHPLNSSTVLYIVQRMTLLSTLFVVLSLLLYCQFREKANPTRANAIAHVFMLAALLIIGVMCKENAVLLVLFTLTIEVFLLRFHASAPGQKLFLQVYYSALLVLPALAAIVLLIFNAGWILGSYELRPFTMGERLLSETRALWTYVGWLVMPDSRELILYHDAFPVSKGLLSPPSTLFSIAGLLAVAAFILKFRVRLPLLCFGLAFFFAGHALESSVLSLELMFEHRNYLPGFGLLFGAIQTFAMIPPNVLGKTARAGLLAAFVLFLVHGSWYEARKWADSHEQLLSGLRQSPDSHRINYALGFLYLSVSAYMPEGERIATLERSSRYFERATALDERATRAHIGYILANSQSGRTLDTNIVDDLVERLQNFTLSETGIVEISMLTECRYGGFCKFADADLVRFYNAIANNDASDVLIIQGILDQLGTAIANVFGQKADALALFYLAQSKSPMMTAIDVKIVLLEIELGNLDKAREALLAARSKPNSARFKADLDELSRGLDELFANQ